MKKTDKILADINSLDANDRVALLSKFFSILHTSQSVISMEYILIAVCSYYNILPEQIQSRSRKREIVLARFVIMYFARKLTIYTSASIGIFCGGRNHATVLYACSKIEKLIGKKKKVKSDIDTLSNLLKIT